MSNLTSKLCLSKPCSLLASNMCIIHHVKYQYIKFLNLIYMIQLIKKCITCTKDFNKIKNSKICKSLIYIYWVLKIH